MFIYAATGGRMEIIMNKYVKDFITRGLMFSGLGPVTVGIVYAILESTLKNFSLSGKEVLLAVISSYLLAFVQAGASVFNQIEHWPLPKSLFFHFLTLYAAYVLCYVVNAWIPLMWEVILIFTAIFVVSYFIIWTVVYLAVRSATNKMNSRLRG